MQDSNLNALSQTTVQTRIQILVVLFPQDPLFPRLSPYSRVILILVVLIITVLIWRHIHHLHLNVTLLRHRDREVYRTSVTMVTQYRPVGRAHKQ